MSSAYSEPVPRIVGVMSHWCPSRAIGAAWASGSWHSADTAIYVPIVVPTTCVARRVWWVNGDTVNASYNIEAGLYLSDTDAPSGKLVTSGSVAQGTAVSVQFADITDTTLTPGPYWLYFSCSTTSATFLRVASPHLGWDELLLLSQGSVGPGSAPATATPAEPASVAAFPLFGFATTASP
jgi:hypothetical protein